VVIWLLAQLDPQDKEAALAKGWWNLSMILLVGTLAVLLLITMFLLRRWKRNQLKAIEADRAKRRAGKSPERMDAWSASAERYVDHDKLPADEDEPFGHDDDPEPGDDEDEGDSYPGDDDTPPDPEEDDRDPFGLFSDKPYQDPEDDDDEEDDEDDWDEEDEDADKR